MFKLTLTAILLVLSFALNLRADDDHTDNVCTSSAPEICAHLGHFTVLNSKDEAQFVVHIMAPEDQQVSNISVDMVMPATGHAAEPVTIAQFGLNKYRVQNAFFNATGQWLVRVRFTLAGVNYLLSVPVSVTE